MPSSGSTSQPVSNVVAARLLRRTPATPIRVRASRGSRVSLATSTSLTQSPGDFSRMLRARPKLASTISPPARAAAFADRRAARRGRGSSSLARFDRASASSASTRRRRSGAAHRNRRSRLSAPLGSRTVAPASMHTRYAAEVVPRRAPRTRVEMGVEAAGRDVAQFERDRAEHARLLAPQRVPGPAREDDHAVLDTRHRATPRAAHHRGTRRRRGPRWCVAARDGSRRAPPPDRRHRARTATCTSTGCHASSSSSRRSGSMTTVISASAAPCTPDSSLTMRTFALSRTAHAASSATRSSAYWPGLVRFGRAVPRGRCREPLRAPRRPCRRTVRSDRRASRTGTTSTTALSSNTPESCVAERRREQRVGLGEERLHVAGPDACDRGRGRASRRAASEPAPRRRRPHRAATASASATNNASRARAGQRIDLVPHHRVELLAAPGRQDEAAFGHIPRLRRTTTLNRAWPSAVGNSPPSHNMRATHLDRVAGRCGASRCPRTRERRARSLRGSSAAVSQPNCVGIGRAAPGARPRRKSATRCALHRCAGPESRD